MLDACELVDAAIDGVVDIAEPVVSAANALSSFFDILIWIKKWIKNKSLKNGLKILKNQIR